MIRSEGSPSRPTGLTSDELMNGSNSKSSPRHAGLPPQQTHAPPSAQGLLANLSPTFFETAPELFDEKHEALAGFGENVDALALSESLLDRVEEIDLARDVVTNSLANEVRRSASSLLAGMRQVQDLDLDVTRTSLHVVAIRRRLAGAKQDLFQAELQVTKFATRRDRLHSIQSSIDSLVEVHRLRKQCDAVTEPLSARIECTLRTRDLVSSATRFPQTLSAVRSTIDMLSRRIPELEERVLDNTRKSLTLSRLDENLFLDVLKCFTSLKKSNLERFEAVTRVWTSIVGKAFEPSAAETTMTAASTTKRPIEKVADTCSSFAQVLQLFSSSHKSNAAIVSSSSRMEEEESGKEEEQDVLTEEDKVPMDLIAKTKREALGMLAKSVDDYLKSPLVRSQVLDDFASTIEDAVKLMENVDGWFGGTGGGDDSSNGAQYFNKTKMESSVRLRARVYVQHYQAEGFQAMRGLLWRESWIDVVAAQDESSDFAGAIFKRLGLHHEPQGANKRFVFTATMASGLPRQVQRTLDLMKKLPVSASGEAFLGLLRIIDLYLLAVCQVFVPRYRFFESKKQMRTAAYLYMTGVRESLGEWLNTTASPRRALPPPPLFAASSIPPVEGEAEEGEVRLCEFEFLEDSERSFEPCYVACESLDFLLALVRALEKPLSDPLPAVERVKLASKMFVELPPVVKQISSLVKRSAVERLCARSQFPDLTYVYTGGDDSAGGGMMMATSGGGVFNDCLMEMHVVFQQITTHPHLQDSSKCELWDDACALFLDKYVNAIARLTKCSAMDRGNMIVHLASFWENLNQIPGSKAMLSRAGTGGALKARNRVDDFIKAFYYDKSADLWDWMKRKREDYEPHHFAAIFETGLLGQSAGTTSYLSSGNGMTRAIGGKRELRQEFEKVLTSIFG